MAWVSIGETVAEMLDGRAQDQRADRGDGERREHHEAAQHQGEQQNEADDAAHGSGPENHADPVDQCPRDDEKDDGGDVLDHAACSRESAQMASLMARSSSAVAPPWSIRYRQYRA